MSSALLLVIAIITIALLFDFINGFHDAANSVATVVATRVLSPFQAVIWAAIFNFIAALTLGTGVAKTVGEGMVKLEFVTPYVVLAGLAGAIIWDVITWWLGLPTSSSHALFGGYAGAAIARASFLGHNGLDPIVWSGWGKTILFMVLAPLIGLVAAYALVTMVYWMFRHYTPKAMDVYFRKLQLLSAGVLSLAHGTNDAQKTMGIIAGVLFAGKFIAHFRVPWWVIVAASSAMGLGTMSGGWRIVHTMGGRITRLKPRSGFCAEAAGAISILTATALGVGVSTTHVITGAVAGVGSIQRVKAVRWGVATNIVWAWILTIPAAGFMAWVAYGLMRAGGLDAGR